jgi:hypothetical protein
MDAARLEKREAWSAPARRKIAPGPAKTGRSHARCAACKKLPENTHTQQRHSRRSSVTGLPRAGEAVTNTPRPLLM